MLQSVHTLEAQVLVHFRCLTFNEHKSMLGLFLKFYFFKSSFFRPMSVSVNSILIATHCKLVKVLLYKINSTAYHP